MSKYSDYEPLVWAVPFVPDVPHEDVSSRKGTKASFALVNNLNTLYEIILGLRKRSQCRPNVQVVIFTTFFSLHDLSIFSGPSATSWANAYNNLLRYYLL